MRVILIAGWIVVAVLAFALVASFFPRHARSQHAIPVQCMPVAILEQRLRDDFNEFPVWMGRNSAGAVFVVSESAGGETWTIYFRSSTIGCIAFAGGSNASEDEPPKQRLGYSP